MPDILEMMARISARRRRPRRFQEILEDIKRRREGTAVGLGGIAKRLYEQRQSFQTVMERIFGPGDWAGLMDRPDIPKTADGLPDFDAIMRELEGRPEISPERPAIRATRLYEYPIPRPEEVADGESILQRWGRGMEFFWEMGKATIEKAPATLRALSEIGAGKPDEALRSIIERGRGWEFIRPITKPVVDEIIKFNSEMEKVSRAIEKWGLAPGEEPGDKMVGMLVEGGMSPEKARRIVTQQLDPFGPIAKVMMDRYKEYPEEFFIDMTLMAPGRVFKWLGGIPGKAYDLEVALTKTSREIPAYLHKLHVDETGGIRWIPPKKKMPRWQAKKIQDAVDTVDAQLDIETIMSRRMKKLEKWLKKEFGEVSATKAKLFEESQRITESLNKDIMQGVRDALVGPRSVAAHLKAKSKEIGLLSPKQASLSWQKRIAAEAKENISQLQTVKSPIVDEAKVATAEAIEAVKDVVKDPVRLKQLWNTYVGTPLWDDVIVPLFKRALPERLRRAFLYGHGRPEEWLREFEELQPRIVREIEKAADEIKEMASHARTPAERNWLGQIRRGGVTMNSEVAQSTRKVIDREAAWWKEAQELGIAPKQTIFSVLTRREVRTLVEEKQRIGQYITRLKNSMKELPKEVRKDVRRAIEGKLSNANARFDEIERRLYYSDIMKGGEVHLKRVYTSKEMEKKLGRYGIYNPNRLDLTWAKARKDIPWEIRQQMGEILEAAYPSLKGVSQLIRDVELAKLFRYTADIPEWAGSKWKEGFAKKAIPDDKKYGALRGLFVQQGIYDDITTTIKMLDESHGLMAKWMRYWKEGKAVWNPATQGRNIRSNIALADIAAELSPWELHIYKQAWKEFKGKGKLFQDASDGGLFRGTFTQAELQPFMDVVIRTKGTMFNRVLSALGKIRQAPPRMYRAVEEYFKLAAFIKQRRLGRTIEDAVRIAKHALFDYDAVPPFIRRLRTKWWGMPFATFTYKALPVVAESLIKRPIRTLKWFLMPVAIEEAARHMLGLTSEELREIRGNLPDYMQTGLYALMPWRDEYGQYQFYDFTWELPWGDLWETGEVGIPIVRNFGSTPMISGLQALAALSGLPQSDRFTGSPIYDPVLDTNLADRIPKVLTWFYRQMMPSLAPGGYSAERVRMMLAGEPTGTGKPYDAGATFLHVLTGMKTRAINFPVERQKRLKMLNYRERQLKMKISGFRKRKDLSYEDKKKKINEVQDDLKDVYQERRELMQLRKEAAEAKVKESDVYQIMQRISEEREAQKVKESDVYQIMQGISEEREAP